MNKRKNGYYWLKSKTTGLLKSVFPDPWLIGEWVGNSYGGFWELTGLTTTFTDKDFEQIDETPIVREKSQGSE